MQTLSTRPDQCLVLILWSYSKFTQLVNLAYLAWAAASVMALGTVK